MAVLGRRGCFDCSNAVGCGGYHSLRHGEAISCCHVAGDWPSTSHLLDLVVLPPLVETGVGGHNGVKIASPLLNHWTVLPLYGFVNLGSKLTDSSHLMKSARSRYHGHRFPPEIIGYAVWVYHRF